MRALAIGLLSFVIAFDAMAAVQFRQNLTGKGSLEKHWTVLSGDWTEEDGVLIGRSTAEADQAWLMFNGERSDFDLTLYFKTPVACNGGVQIRSHWMPKLPLKEGEAPEHDFHGYQMNIDTRAEDVTGNILDKNGRWGMVGTSPEAQAVVKPTDWNKMTIVARGPLMEVYLNGVLANRLHDERYLSGFVGLQVEALADGSPGEIHYKDISLPQYDHGRLGDWTSLFNGENLDGWTVWGTEEFSVEDGTIVGRSGPKKSEGYLLTDGIWKDFRVRGRFKMLGEGNFGLFYRSTIAYDAEEVPRINGIQGEVMPGRPAETGRHYESYRRGWLNEENHDDIGAWALRENEWNEIEIRGIGNRITSWVNGIQVTDFHDDNPQVFEGGFALQLHSGGVDGIAWKELYVTEP
jgi:hypothetical protein